MIPFEFWIAGTLIYFLSFIVPFLACFSFSSLRVNFIRSLLDIHEAVALCLSMLI
jgi:hypothetical protein